MKKIAMFAFGVAAALLGATANADTTSVTLDLSLLSDAHVSAADLQIEGGALCVTNGTVVSWTVPKNTAFEIVYTVAEAATVKDGVTSFYPSTAGICWVLKMPPKGCLLSIQ